MNKKELKVDDLSQTLWKSADALRGNVSSEQYMLIIIGIMFLKQMSDKYNHAIKAILEKYPDEPSLIHDRDYLSQFGSPFIINEKANWNYIIQFATQLEIGEKIDEAFHLIEEGNPELKGLFEKNYNRPELDQRKLAKVVSNFENYNSAEYSEDIIGRTYEYFLGEFFKKQGQKGGEFYTPKSIVELMVNILNPECDATIYDPCFGTGGMFVQAKQYIEKKGQKIQNLVVYGQEYQNKTWKLAKINLLINGFDSGAIKLGASSADTFTNDLHKNHKFDYVIANPPFNLKVWWQEDLANDKRWKWGNPPKNNANFAWLSHIVSKLNSDGKAAVILANGSLSTSQKLENEIKKSLLKENKIDMIITLPDKLFYTTGISASIWVFNNHKKTNDVLMVDASNFGKLISKSLRELSHEDSEKISNVYFNYLKGNVIDFPDLAKSVSYNEIEENGFSLVPQRYISSKEEEINEEEVKNQIDEIAIELENLFDEFNELVPEVKESIKIILNKKEVV